MEPAFVVLGGGGTNQVVNGKSCPAYLQRLAHKLMLTRPTMPTPVRSCVSRWRVIPAARVSGGALIRSSARARAEQDLTVTYECCNRLGVPVLVAQMRCPSGVVEMPCSTL